MTSTRYSQIIGSAMVLISIMGLASSTTPGQVGAVIGSIDMNLNHAMLLLVAGLFAVAGGFLGAVSTRSVALCLGILFGALGVVGFVAGPGFEPFGLAVNTGGTIMHTIIGALGLLVWMRDADEVADMA
jgi:hypothetical protein